MKTDYFVSVIAPLHEDADILEQFVNDVITLLEKHYYHFELILVEDGLSKSTLDCMANLLTKYQAIRLIRLSRKFGEEAAISAGLASAIGDFIVVMLPNTDPPEIIPSLVNTCAKGVGILSGVRRDRKEDGFFTRLAASIFYWYCNQVIHINIPKNSTLFRCMTRQAANAINQIKDPSCYLRLFSTYVGFSHDTFTYDLICRRHIKSRKDFFESISRSFSIIIENSAHPLRVISLIGLTASIFNLLYVVYIFLILLFKENIAPGWVTLSLQNAGQFFITCLILTALCEYTGRMFNKLKGRPPYFILEEKNSSVMVSDISRINVTTESFEQVF